VKPISNPKIILKIRREIFADKETNALLLKAHTLASTKGILYFANLSEKDQECSTFSGSGCKVGADLSGDWEIDVLRTGCLGHLTINLPRLAYESQKDEAKFLETLKSRLDMACRALEIKYRSIKQHARGLQPFLMQDAGGDQYFRLENCSDTISLVGFREAVEAFYGKSVQEDEKTREFADKVAHDIVAFTQRVGRRRGKRLLPALLPSFDASRRLAQSDIERYGIGKVRFSGTRDRPFYSTLTKLSVREGTIVPDPLMSRHGLDGLHAGGSLAAIELGDIEYDAERLMSLTRQVVENHKVPFFMYDRNLTYCTNCKKSWFGLLNKCPSCGATSTLIVSRRFPFV
jgi:ribonucleoside-triphosphate reductase